MYQLEQTKPPHQKPWQNSNKLVYLVFNLKKLVRFIKTKFLNPKGMLEYVPVGTD